MPEDHGIVEKTLKERDIRSGGWHGGQKGPLW